MKLSIIIAMVAVQLAKPVYIIWKKNARKQALKAAKAVTFLHLANLLAGNKNIAKNITLTLNDTIKSTSPTIRYFDFDTKQNAWEAILSINLLLND